MHQQLQRRWVGRAASASLEDGAGARGASLLRSAAPMRRRSGGSLLARPIAVIGGRAVDLQAYLQGEAGAGAGAGGVGVGVGFGLGLGGRRQLSSRIRSVAPLQAAWEWAADLSKMPRGFGRFEDDDEDASTRKKKPSSSSKTPSSSSKKPSSASAAETDGKATKEEEDGTANKPGSGSGSGSESKTTKKKKGGEKTQAWTWDSFGANDKSKGKGGGGGSGGGGGGGGEEGPPIGASQLLTGALALFLLYSLMNNSEQTRGKEINWQEFKSHLLAAGEVERVVVVNKQIAKVYVRGGAAGAAGAGRPGQASAASGQGQGQGQGHGHGQDVHVQDDVDMYNQNGQGGGAGSPGGSAYPRVLHSANPEASQYYFTIGSIDSFERKLELAQREMGISSRSFVPVQYVNETNWTTEAAKFAPTLLIIGAWLFLMRGMSGGAGGGGMNSIFKIGKSNASMIGKDQKVGVTFKDVAGCDEAKVEIMEFVEFLKDPSRFTKLGAKIPKGALLCGPPGTGKTLLAKATAGEASVPFYSISGSDFIEMFVGVGPSRVRDLFAQARKNAPCIVFIDEIDAVARARSKGGFSGGNDERENTLNQLLVEMDGFSTKEGVVVLAGTNRMDILDPAILRPGRFDRQITVDLPDIRGRKEIFLVHLKGINVAGNFVDADEKAQAKAKDGKAEAEGEGEGEAAGEAAGEGAAAAGSTRAVHDAAAMEVAQRLAALTPGFSGAQIANVCNEAAILAARQGKERVDMEAFEGATDRVIGGLEKKNAVMSKEDLRTVAFHEAGHAIVGWYLEHCDPLLKVTIIPRMSGALGFAQYLPKEMALHSQEQLLDRIAMALGGRAAEELTFGRVTTGASDDLNKVTQIAYSMVKQFGMSPRLGTLSFPDEDQGGFGAPKKYSEATAQLIDEEVNELVVRTYARTKKLLLERKDAMDTVAKLLLEKETITQHDIAEAIGPRPFKASESYEDFLNAAGTGNDEPAATTTTANSEEEEAAAAAAAADADAAAAAAAAADDAGDPETEADDKDEEKKQ